MIKSCVDSAPDGPLDVTNLGWDRTPLQDVSTRACPLEFRDEGSFFLTLRQILVYCILLKDIAAQGFFPVFCSEEGRSHG
jgi:hypothetical protein